MIDLTSLKPWIAEAPKYYILSAATSINSIGFEQWFEKQCTDFLDCSKLDSNGHRQIQTNYNHYKSELNTVFYMIEQHGGEDKDKFYEKIWNLHNANLEFEAINGFEYKHNDTTRKKSTKKTSSTKSNKQTDLFHKEPKETAAERKLKARAVKLSLFNVKLKPATNDKTLQEKR